MIAATESVGECGASRIDERQGCSSNFRTQSQVLPLESSSIQF